MVVLKVIKVQLSRWLITSLDSEFQWSGKKPWAGLKVRRQMGPGWVAQLLRASSQYTKLVGSIPGQGTYEKQPMNASISETTN